MYIKGCHCKTCPELPPTTKIKYIYLAPQIYWGMIAHIVAINLALIRLLITMSEGREGLKHNQFILLRFTFNLHKQLHIESKQTFNRVYVKGIKLEITNKSNMSSFPNFSVCNDKAYILGMIFNTSLLFLAG